MQQLDQNAKNEIIEKLLNNEILILPTDTIYGLSLLVKNNSPRKLNELKQADLNKPVIMLIADFATISDLVEFEENDVELLNSSTPTTVIFKLKEDDKTIGIRICQRNDLNEIIQVVGAIYSTSVNLSGNDPITDQESLNNFLGNSKNVYWVGPLNNLPSKIYNSITKEWIR